MHTQIGTRSYMAPEILIENDENKISYTTKVDVWSLGILIYFLCTKRLPFKGNSFKSLHENILQNL